MNHRTLGKTNLSVTEIGVGAWQLGGPLLLDGKTDGHPDLGEEFVIDLIRRCGEELGMNFIDTAEQYGAGNSERRVGIALKGQRDRWILGTKFGNLVGDAIRDPVTGAPSGKRLADASAQRLPVSLEGSLRRLQTDYIDVYIYHCAPDPNDAEAVAGLLEAAKKKGQVRAVGISTNNIEQIEKLHALGCLDVVQFAESLLNPQTDLRALLLRHQVGGVVRGAFAQGRLTGKYFHKAPHVRPDDMRFNRFAGDRSAATADYAKYAVFEEIAKPDRTVSQTALRYLLDQPTTHTIVLGAKSFDDYKTAAAATTHLPLSAPELSKIAALRELVAKP